MRSPGDNCTARNLSYRISAFGFIPTIESDRAIQAALPIEPDHTRSGTRRKHIDEDVHEPDLPRTDLNQGILADHKCGELDLWVDWWDKDFKDFGPVSAGANAGLVEFRWTGCEGSLGAEPLRWVRGGRDQHRDRGPQRPGREAGSRPAGKPRFRHP